MWITWRSTKRPPLARDTAGAWNIFAEVRGHELTTRQELFRDQPDHPRAREEYFKIQIWSITGAAPTGAADRWKRVTFLYTTGELMQRAQTLRDLVTRDEEREILWRTLRERALQKPAIPFR
jgi:hypothetical protein